MTRSIPKTTFNLWSEPWITLERTGAPPERAGIEKTLMDAHKYHTIYDSSPLVIAGIFRLLVAILQESLCPQRKQDLNTLWKEGRFPVKRVNEFGEKYFARFDLFSQDTPFLQSSSLPLVPSKGDKIETVSRLSSETSPLTALDHYRHNNEMDEYFCPSCLAAGLVTIPPFTGIGGRGYKTSINGTPPLYILPMGRNLFEALTLSLLLPDENYWPPAASREQDLPWWKHSPIVEQNKEVIQVGYLQSLTFPARQVRLHPVELGMPCTRCGKLARWGAKTMVFEMGECRARGTDNWLDPFVAYHLPNEGKSGSPWPVLPNGNKALWREFAGLFLYPPREGKNRVQRPSILERIANEADFAEEIPTLHFRCIGIEGKQAKALEWMDASYGMSISLMNDEDASYKVKYAIQFAEEVEKIISYVFTSKINPSQRRERHKDLKEQMISQYWQSLAEPFRFFFLSLIDKENRMNSVERWSMDVVKNAQSAFDDNIGKVGEDAISMRGEEEGKKDCHIRLNNKRIKFLKGKGGAI